MTATTPPPKCKDGSYPVWRESDGGYWACIDCRKGIPQEEADFEGEDPDE